jgi:hypothetical protein
MIRRSIAPRSTCSISRISAALALSAALVLSMDTSVCAASAPVARIARAEGATGANGAVSVKYRGTDSFVSVWRHEKVGSGDTIATGSGGVAEIAFPGGTRLVLGSPATLEITGIAPRRAGDGGSGDRLVYDISVRLESGAIRAAAPPGGIFTLSMGGGTITVVTSPKTGGDITAAMGVFASGEYASVRAGCAYFTGSGGGPITLCAPDGLPSGLRFGRGAPTPVDESPVDLVFTGEPPAIETDAGLISEIIRDEKALAPVAGGASDIPAEELPAGESETADPEAVASRFVQAFTAALTRGDTGALSALVSPDYSGSVGGAGRSAMLRGVSDFFRAGGTLSVSAYVTSASTADRTIIATMSFSSRVNGAPRSGNLRLWLTPDGTLTHAEGQWVL